MIDAICIRIPVLVDLTMQCSSFAGSVARPSACGEKTARASGPEQLAVRKGVALQCPWCKLAVRGCPEWLGGVDPLIVTEEKPNAARNSAIVAARSRLGVSQVWCCAWSQERVPVAPAAAAITHPAHMEQTLPPASVSSKRGAATALRRSRARHGLRWGRSPLG